MSAIVIRPPASESSTYLFADIYIVGSRGLSVKHRKKLPKQKHVTPVIDPRQNWTATSFGYIGHQNSVPYSTAVRQ